VIEWGEPGFANFTAQFEYRRCIKMPGLTKYIVVCPKCRAVLESVHVEYSRTGAHGREFYTHEHPMEWVCLERSNSGKRRIAVSPFFERFRALLEHAWVHEGCSVEEMRQLVEGLLSNLKAFEVASSEVEVKKDDSEGCAFQ